ncbi:hypothetical protein Nmel_007531 [Mimus melanotis]
MERENRKVPHKLKLCCSACSIELSGSPGRAPDQTPSLPGSPVSSHTRAKVREQPVVLQAPLREAVGPDGMMTNTSDLEIWKKNVKDYRTDTINIAGYFWLIVKQHNPDWNDIQSLLHAMAETEKQLILKVAWDLAEEHYMTRGHGGEGGGCKNVKESFPLQDPKWDVNRMAERQKLQEYQE